MHSNLVLVALWGNDRWQVCAEGGLTKEGGSHSDLDAAVVEKHESQIFRDFGELGSRCHRSGMGTPGSLGFTWGHPIWRHLGFS